MILLALIAVGLLSLSSISMRTGKQAQDMLDAKANARLALMIALGQLQGMAGPDQRVTAAASVVQTSPEPANPNWFGVWSTTEQAAGGIEPTVERPMVGPYESPGYLTDLRESNAELKNGEWKRKLRLGWLVSGENPDPTQAYAPAKDIVMVGQGSADITKPGARVSVPKVSLPGGAYAYWVADESSKAKAAVNHPYAGKTPNRAQGDDGGYYRLAGAEPPEISVVKSAARTPYAPAALLNDAERNKLATWSQVSLAGAAGDITQDDLRNNFHDMTAVGMSVHSNPRRGGLKKDLTTLLEQQRTGSTRGVGLSANPLLLEQVRPETPVIDGTWHKFTGPRFDHLAAWYRLMDEMGTSQVGQYTLAPRYLDSRQTSVMTSVKEGWTMNHLEKNGNTFSKMPVLLQPRMVDFKMHFDFTRDMSRAEGRAIRCHLYPRLVLWNPYNVKLAAKRYVIMAPPNFPAGNVIFGGDLANKSVNIAGDPNEGKLLPGDILAYTVEATEFEPGECLVFTPMASASSGPMIGGNSALYDKTDISKNILSAKKPADLQSFYFPSGLKVPDGVDLDAPQLNYAMYSSMFSSLYMYLLKRAPDSGPISPAVLDQEADYATIGRYVLGTKGLGGTLWWIGGVDTSGWSDHPVNDAPSGFITHESNPERNPPRLWFGEARQRWFDESVEQASVGPWGPAKAVRYNLPLIASYNVRAPIVHRSQFCYLEDWPQFNPGGFHIPWSSERTFGTPQDAPFVGGKALGSPWGLAGDWAAMEGRYPLFDLPSQKVGVFSLAAFQHAEIGFQTWLPSYIIGHSLAESRSDRDATANRAYFAVHPKNSQDPGGAPDFAPWDQEFGGGNGGNWQDLIQSGDQTGELLAYDIAYETNHYLWDDYFLSTIPFRRNVSAPNITWNAVTALPNSRQVLNPWLGMSPADLVKKFTTVPAGSGYQRAAAYPFHHAAAFLLNDGGFNVNSTSEEAWRAVLSSCRDVSRPTLSGGGVSGVNFSRLLAPPTANTNGDLMSSAGWSGTRVLTDDEITTLAKEIVKEVKLRGPFLSMSDFVNRRLTQSEGLTAREGGGPDVQNPSDTSTRGPLQAAIEHANLNQTYQQSSNMYAMDRTGKLDGSLSAKCTQPDYDAMPDSKAYGLPGYLTQADILQRLGPNLTVRGDTLVVRGYGEKTDPQGKVLAKAWCEAVVQRLPEYVDGRSINDYGTGGTGNHPAEPLTIVDTQGNLTVNNRITSVNKRFGRKFALQSFRWLHPDEI